MRPPQFKAHPRRLLPPIPCGAWFIQGLAQRLNAVFGPPRGDQCSTLFPFWAA